LLGASSPWAPWPAACASTPHAQCFFILSLFARGLSLHTASVRGVEGWGRMRDFEAIFRVDESWRTRWKKNVMIKWEWSLFQWSDVDQVRCNQM
jgi:hypothetical protein